MKSTINQRIELLIEQKGKNVNSFSMHISMPRQTVERVLKGKYMPKYDILNAISNTFPLLNTRWLLTGDGEMWMDSTNMTHEPISEYSLKDTPSISELIHNQLSTIKSDEPMDKELVSRLVSLIEKQQNDIHLSLEIQHNLVLTLSFLGEQKKASGHGM